MRPLVFSVRAPHDVVLWAEGGRLFRLIAERWVEVTETPGMAGHVLTESQLEVLKKRVGVPHVS